MSYQKELKNLYQLMGISQANINHAFKTFDETVRYRYTLEIIDKIETQFNTLAAEGKPVGDRGRRILHNLNNTLDQKSKRQYEKALTRFEELTFPDEATKAEVLKNIQIIGAYINDEELPSYPS
jgi:hypothetical protein